MVARLEVGGLGWLGWGVGGRLACPACYVLCSGRQAPIGCLNAPLALCLNLTFHTAHRAQLPVPDPLRMLVDAIARARILEYLPTSGSNKDGHGDRLGRIGPHNVVVAVLPMGRYGTTSAAMVDRDMVRSFPNIRIGLMVGIGGGTPTRLNDIRLGDVVVGISKSGQGEVFQYDFGKTIQSQEFQRIPSQNNVPVLLQTAVHGLQSDYERKGHGIRKAIEDIVQRNR